MTPHRIDQKSDEKNAAVTSRTKKRKVVSEFPPSSYLTKNTSLPRQSQFIQIFSRNGISYKPQSQYQQFFFQVQRRFPQLDYYKIKIVIAHFSLDISVAQFDQPNKISADICGNFGTISFIQMGKQKLCLKSFKYKTHSLFHILFPAVVKEYAVLKICSALECAPHLPDLLGFDLLIFQDCIQFACEKGEEILWLSEQNETNLKNELFLLHLFNIMHLDIKPENIIFSQHFGKAVFIDFGFSQIIEEQIGFKSLTTFKGTPNFCSPQMLTLMLQNEGYIDLYHNDTYSMELTLRSIQNKLGTRLGQKEYSLLQLTVNKIQNVSLYSTYAFQYCYLQYHQFKAREALIFCLNFNKNNVKKVLQFIKATSRAIYIPEILQIDLKEYSYMVEYNEIENDLKHNARKFFYKTCHNNSTSINQGKVSIINFQLEIFHSGTLVHQNFQHYFNILLGLNKLYAETVMNFVAVAFQCIRFDLRNLQVSEKKQIACKMNVLLLKYLQRDNQQFIDENMKYNKQMPVDEERQSLLQIKVLLLLIFEFCLTHIHKYGKWIKKHLFDVCQQIIFVDISFLDYIDKLVNCVQKHFTQPKQKVFVMLQYSRLYDTVNIVDSFFEDKLEATRNKLEQMVRIYLNAITQNSLFKEIEMTSIQQMLIVLQDQTDNSSKYSFQIEQAKISLVSDIQIRKRMLLLLTKKKIEYYFAIMCHEQIFKIAEFIKRSSDIQSLDFLSLAMLIIKILKGLHNQTGVNEYCKYIKSVINCQSIFNSLLINQKHQNIDNISTQTKLKTIYEKHSQSFHYQNFTNDIFNLLVLIQKRKISLDSSMREQFINLYSLFKESTKGVFRNRRLAMQVQLQQFINIYFQIKIEFFFFQLSTDTQDVFLSNLFLSQEEYKKIYAKQQTIFDIEHRYRLIFCTLNMNFYQLYLHIHFNNYQTCFNCLTQIKQMLKCLKLHSLLLEIHRLQINLAVRCRKIEQIQRAVHNLYDLCSSIQYAGFYLLPSSKTQLYVTLAAFQSAHSPLFYTLTNELISFLQAHPVEQYFQSFITALDTFLAFNHSNSYAIHYSQFVEDERHSKVKYNPYFLIFYAYSLLNQNRGTQCLLFKTIMLHCDCLSPYAKMKILQKCFSVYFKYLRDMNKCQAMFVFRRVKQFIMEKKRKRILMDIKCISFSKNRKAQTLRKHLNYYKQYLS